jgi:hypothetical protein
LWSWGLPCAYWITHFWRVYGLFIEIFVLMRILWISILKDLLKVWLMCKGPISNYYHLALINVYAQLCF